MYRYLPRLWALLSVILLCNLALSPIAAARIAQGDVSAANGPFTLVLARSGAGEVAATPPGEQYAAGTLVQLVPTPATDTLFIGWTVDGVSQGWSTPLTVQMDANHTVVATFAPRTTFSDTGDDEAIAQLAARGIIRGYQDGRFGPQDAVLRAQIAALLCRTLDWEGEEHDTPFSDREELDAELWRDVGTLAARGIARGYADGTYHPTEAVIQAQTISFITRALIAQGSWRAQPDDGGLYPELPAGSGHRGDVATYVHYAGRFPDAADGTWTAWQSAATRQWFARTLWQALTSASVPTLASTPDPTPTAMATPISTGTPRATATSTMNPTPTASPMRTSTPAPAATATQLPTATATPTATPSPIATATAVPTPDTRGFVGRQGTQFTLGGQPFRFVGFNLFDAAATASYQCAWWTRYSDEELDAALGAMKGQAGASVLRFWAFQSYTAGGTDWSGIDRVLRLARKHEIKVIPVLENGQAHCGNYGAAKWQQGDTFYRNAIRRDYTYGSPLSLPDYIDRIVGRYKDDPTIMAWMIMNEADTGDKEGLYAFAAALSTQIKALDSRHLVTLGTQSNGVSGSSGSDFIRLYSLPTLDFAEGHDYAFWGGDTDPLPGSTDGKTLPAPGSAACLSTAYVPNQAKIACSIAQAQQILGKPYLIGEAGIGGASDVAGRQRRADLLGAKMEAFFANGGGGYIVWQWNRVVDTEGFDVLGTMADPLLPKMKRYAEAFATQR
ncbi:MAG TPA: S-layer homology domain-containing protein [Thermomicrobiales bacterium]|jgi:hypothetical protein